MKNQIFESGLLKEFPSNHRKRYWITTSEFVSPIKYSVQIIKRQFLMAIISLFTLPVLTYANHAQAPVSDIDYTGMGTFSGFYTHSLTDHVWFVFNANAGDVINVTVTTPEWLSTVWLYQANDDCVDIGDDSYSNNCLLFLQQYGVGQNSYTFTTTLSNGQFAIQLDSYEGQSGTYIVSISGSTATTILCHGTCNTNDHCPDDPNKTDPGQCGCGVPDTDSDGDGVADCNDGCPNDPNKSAPGECGCGHADEDSDCDGVADCIDQCPGGNDGFDYNHNGIPDCKDLPPFANLPASWKCGNNKVYVCHIPPGNHSNSNTLCVSYNAVQAHLNHGDYLGPCGEANCGVIAGTGNGHGNGHGNDHGDHENGEDHGDDHGDDHGNGHGNGYDIKTSGNKASQTGENVTNVYSPISSDDEIKLYPNPAQDMLYIKLAIPAHSNIQIQLYNNMGKQLYNQQYPGNQDDETIISLNTKSYLSGLYFIEAIVDGKKQVKTFSIIK